jgi:nucleotide-binding universal stress UspA family protein
MSMWRRSQPACDMPGSKSPPYTTENRRQARNPEAEYMFKKILVAFDGSEGSRKALKKAIDLAACFNAELHSISVEVDLPQYVATVGEFEEVKRRKDEYFEELNREAMEMAEAGKAPIKRHIVAGHAVDKVVDFCKREGFDLIVVGFTGHSRIYERIWGGTSRNIARFAPCAVLIVK